MARRKVTTRKSGTKPPPKPIDRRDSKINKWNTLKDVPLDDEDAFHEQRDEIALSQDDDDDLDQGQDEVFALEGMPSSSDEEESEADHDEDMPSSPQPTKKASRAKSKSKLPARVTAIPEQGSDDADDDDEGWGHKKTAYYTSNIDDISESDEEAQEMAEKEVRRLQAKARDLVTETDFGFLDNDPQDVASPIDVFEALPQIPPPALPRDKASVLSHLEKTNPEALALARDWEDVTHDLIKVQKAITRGQDEDPDNQALGLVHLHHQSLLTYVTTLAFYFYLRSSPKYAIRPELLASHPILSRLVTLKQALASLEDLNFNASDSGEDSELCSDEVDLLWDRRGELDSGELEDLLRDAEIPGKASPRVTNPEKAVSGKPESGPIPKKRRKPPIKDEAAKVQRPKFDLVEPTFTRSKEPSRSHEPDLTTFGEVTVLEHSDAADKKARKKSLRFHTSNIEKASMRREGARLNALGGDDDIPYRERQKEKERKMRERGLGTGGDDLEKIEDRKRPREEDGEIEGENGYYELVKKRKKQIEAVKQATYDAQKELSKPSVPEDPVSGPRSLTRAILVNKGLTPRRSKSVRNPRVKKRQKFEKAKKRISSQKAIYKGGLASTGGHYSGEQSGISARLVKSVKL